MFIRDAYAKNRVTRLVLLITGLLAVGCGAVKMYPGPELTRDKIAVLEIRNVTVYALDGIPPSLGNKKTLQILPGEHVMRMSHNIGGYGEQPVDYTFTAEPGHAYILDADYEIQKTLSWRPWVRDTATGLIIGSWKP